jgi:dihydrofolate reductase
MGKVGASITISVDGYITGPDDRPGQGLGVGGERLHHWVMGGPWSYETDRAIDPGAEMGPDEREWIEAATANMGAAIVGRNMYEASGHWGDENPWGVPTFIVTHRPQEQPEGDAFTFVGSFEEAMSRAKEAAGDKDVAISGGADVIRQGLEADLVDDLSIIIAPVILGGGKRLFEGFTRDVELEHVGVRQTQFATFIDYRVKRA